MTSLRLIWPPAVLHPNARPHWAARARAAKQYRMYAKAVARTAGIQAFDGDVAVRLNFFPPDKRKRDRDGLQSSMKNALDGIADALGVDDSRFRPFSDICEKDPAGLGFVEIHLEPWDREARSIGELIAPIMGAIEKRLDDAA